MFESLIIEGVSCGSLWMANVSLCCLESHEQAADVSNILDTVSSSVLANIDICAKLNLFVKLCIGLHHLYAQEP